MGWGQPLGVDDNPAITSTHGDPEGARTCRAAIEGEGVLVSEHAAVLRTPR